MKHSAHESNYCGKVPKFSAESLCLRQEILRQFGNFSTIIRLCVQNVSSENMFPESKNIHSPKNTIFLHFVNRYIERMKC